MAGIAALLLIGCQRLTGRPDYGNGIKFWFAEQVRAWTPERLAAELAPPRAGPAG